MAKPFGIGGDLIQRQALADRLPDQQVLFRLVQVARLWRGPGSKGVFRQNPQSQTVDGRDIGPLNRKGGVNQPFLHQALPDAPG